MATYREPLIFPPKSEHTHSIILLHGRGLYGHDFGSDLLKAIDSRGNTLQKLFPCMKFIFPTATERPSTQLGGYAISSWFDCFSLIDPGERSELQIEGLRESSTFIHGVLDKESQEIGIENVFLGGLSQGCATALYTLLTYLPVGGRNLGGFVGISGWLPMQKPLDQFAIAARGQKNRQTARLEEDSQVADHNLDIQARAIDLARHLINIPKVNGSTAKHGQLSVFMGHGEADDGVSVALGRVAASTLTNLGLGVTFKTYEGLGHWWRDGDEIDDIAQFLASKSGLATVTSNRSS